jgi:hypothetical protein
LGKYKLYGNIIIKEHQGIEHEILDWIYIDLDRGQWQGLVKIVNVRVPYKTESLLPICCVEK